MDGYAASRAIRSHEALSGVRRTPIVAITAYTLDGDREKCLAAGKDDFPGQPYSLRDLRPQARALAVRNDRRQGTRRRPHRPLTLTA